MTEEYLNWIDEYAHWLDRWFTVPTDELQTVLRDRPVRPGSFQPLGKS
jgi:hypothetical protein